MRNVSYSKGTSCGGMFRLGTFVRNVSYTVRGQVVGECFVEGTFVRNVSYTVRGQVVGNVSFGGLL